MTKDVEIPKLEEIVKIARFHKNMTIKLDDYEFEKTTKW